MLHAVLVQSKPFSQLGNFLKLFTSCSDYAKQSLFWSLRKSSTRVMAGRKQTT